MPTPYHAYPPNNAPAPRRVLIDIPDGPAGTRVTLALMRRLVNEVRADARVLDLADKIVARARGKDFYHEAELIDAWVRRNIRYQRDPDQLEMISGPLVTLDRRAGDCDDICILEAALLKAAGHPVQFVAVSTVLDVFEHVYIRTLVGNRWIGSDCTENQPFGWEPSQGVISRMIRDV